MKRPDHCKGCTVFHSAGHPKGSKLHGSVYDAWCPKYGKPAASAVGECKLKKGKQETR